MFDWLFEGQIAVYALLGFLALPFLFLWLRSRKKKFLIGIGVCGSLALLHALLNVLVETDREQIARKLNEIRLALNEKDIDGVFKHVSEKFRYGTLNKEQARVRAKSDIGHFGVSNVRMWDINLESLDQKAGQAKVYFRVKDSAVSGAAFMFCHLEWVLEENNQWRIKSFYLSNPAANSTEPYPIPGWGLP